MVWYGMVWYGMVWYGTVRYGMYSLKLRSHLILLSIIKYSRSSVKIFISFLRTTVLYRGPTRNLQNKLTRPKLNTRFILKLK